MLREQRSSRLDGLVANQSILFETLFHRLKSTVMRGSEASVNLQLEQRYDYLNFTFISIGSSQALTSLKNLL